MKNTVLALLTVIILIGLLNLLSGFGLLGSGGGSIGGRSGQATKYEYQALSPQQMDSLGFRAIAEEEGLEISEEGEINFPKEIVDKIAKSNMLPRTITEVEEDGGWEFVAVTADNFYIFRRAK